MIRETLEHVAKNYLDATHEEFAEHPIAQYLRRDAPKAVSEALANPYYVCKGSNGQGAWAEVPWIGIFDPTITTSATRGYYVVYLFGADMKDAHLVLGQGTTAVREDFKNKTGDALLRFAALMRDRLPEAKGRFSTGPIELHGNSTLAHDYEPAIALCANYRIASLPSEEKLRDDLHEMVRLYAKLIARGGRDTFEDASDTADQESKSQTIVERRRYRQHRKIDRNSKAAKAAKKVHGYVCQCCGFDFAAIYGELGEEYIEAHHLTPLSELPEDQPVSQDPEKDFAVLCANCHRMIHRKEAPKSVVELRTQGRIERLSRTLRALHEAHHGER